jgi:hypothetical protein
MTAIESPVLPKYAKADAPAPRRATTVAFPVPESVATRPPKLVLRVNPTYENELIDQA